VEEAVDGEWGEVEMDQGLSAGIDVSVELVEEGGGKETYKFLRCLAFRTRNVLVLLLSLRRRMLLLRSANAWSSH